MKWINYMIIALFLSSQPSSYAQKTSPIDYIDAGLTSLGLTILIGVALYMQKMHTLLITVGVTQSLLLMIL